MMPLIAADTPFADDAMITPIFATRFLRLSLCLLICRLCCSLMFQRLRERAPCFALLICRRYSDADDAFCYAMPRHFLMLMPLMRFAAFFTLMPRC